MKNSKAMTVLKDNLWTNNPIFIQILGICSTLAVTNNLRNTLIMTARRHASRPACRA